MQSYTSQNYPSNRNTYERESRGFDQYVPYNSSRNIKNTITINSGSLSNTPIILCETGRSSTDKRSHRYLFYPSIYRLSPFSDNMTDYNIMSGTNIRNNYSNHDESNLKRERNQLINNETPMSVNNNDDMDGEETKNDVRRNKGFRSESMGNPRNSKQYQTMFDKNFELVKTISNIIPDEDAKIKGDSSYYYNRDKDYDKILDKYKTYLTDYFKNINNQNNNLNRTGSNIYKNSNNQMDNKSNYNQFQSDTLDRNNNNNNNQNIGTDYGDINRNNNNNNFGSYSGDNTKGAMNNNNMMGNNSDNYMNNKNIMGNNSDNNKDYMNKNTNYNNSNTAKNYIIRNNNNDDNNPNNNDILNNNNNNLDNNEDNPYRNYYNKTGYDNNYEPNSRTNDNNFDKNNRGFSTFPNNNNMNTLNNNFNNHSYNNDYNDNNNINNNKGVRSEMKAKTVLHMNNNQDYDNNNNYMTYSSNENSRGIDNENKVEGKRDSNNFNSTNRLGNENEINQRSGDNKNGNKIKNNTDKDSNFNSGMSNKSTNEFTQNNALRYQSQPNKSNINMNNNSQSSQRQIIQDNNNDKQNNNSSTKKNNVFQSSLNNMLFEEIKEENEDEKEIEKMQVLDENNNQMISEKGEAFEIEKANEIFCKDNRTYAKTKSGNQIKLSVMHNNEGYPLAFRGYPILGSDNKIFINKGNPIIYPNEDYLKDNKGIPIKIQGLKNGNINNNNDPLDDLKFSYLYATGGIGGGGTSVNELKKSRIKKREFFRQEPEMPRRLCSKKEEKN